MHYAHHPFYPHDPRKWTISLFPPEALPFWREHGASVGEVLRPKCALTLAELAAACQEHTPQQISAATLLPPGETWLARDWLHGSKECGANCW